MAVSCQLYETAGCHLCEQAQLLLMPFVQGGVQIELIDIAESEALVERYGLRIPVLRREDNGAELGWPFTPEDVAAFLR